MAYGAGVRDLPVAVIGAGPIGLVAAAHLLARGERPLVLEAGDEAGASVREWGHVRLFSPWRYLVEPVARELLEARGWEMPDEERLPTGAELVEHWIEPLAAALRPYLRTGSRVVSVGRAGVDKVRSAGREAAPFELVVRGPDGRRERVLARAVIDASGTWTQPNPMGAGGIPADGEAEASARIRYGIPDALGAERDRYVGRRTLVVGSGHSAFNAVLDLAALSRQEPGTEVVWAIRREEPGLMFGGGSRDQLEARGSLGARLRLLAGTGEVRLVTGFRATRVVDTPFGARVEGEGGREIGPVDEIVVATGFRPDLALTREVRVRLDEWLEAPAQLAPLIDPNLHSCGTVYPHGAAELSHPETGFFIVGMKSYGRAPTFLLLTGYEQVRSVVASLSGDAAGAADVRLVLPETGVCSTDLVESSCWSATDEPTASFCGVAPDRPSGLPVRAARARAAACCG